MPRNDALITPELLIWARERISMPVELVAKAIGVTVEQYQSWESGEQLPTINQAKKFAQKVRVAYAWLFLDTPPQKFKLPKNADYRTFANQAMSDYSIELNYLLIDISMRRDAMIELYAEMDTPLPRFEEYMDAETVRDITIAETIRQLLGITYTKQQKFKDSNEAFNYYREALSSIGILVFQAGNIDKSIMRGMSVYDPVFPIIVVNRKDEYNARIFTLLHEFVHILTRTPGICDTFSIEHQSQFEIEIRCNRIAAEALVPQDTLMNDSHWNKIAQSNLDDVFIRKTARKFSVSREVIIGRLLTLGKITFDFYNAKLSQYNNEYEQYQRNQKSKKRGFLPPSTNICSQVGKLYAQTVMNAYTQEVITPRDASQFLSGLRVQHFDKVERWCFS
ncbi:XRE family transcriptional regulator [Selenomonadales bacterium OttesenSCG-928-I06]|nr:XRE family transcriptional regulator [Selenomonadales bacterium OttesenSCG-928-I06]